MLIQLIYSDFSVCPDSSLFIAGNKKKLIG